MQAKLPSCFLQLPERKTLVMKHNEFIFLINTTKKCDTLISYWHESTFRITVAETYSQWLSLFLLIPLSQRCLKNVIHQVDGKNEWLLLSVTFTAKFEYVFVLTFENTFFQGCHFKTNRKSIDSSKKRYQGFQNSPTFNRSACFYVTISESFKTFLIH